MFELAFMQNALVAILLISIASGIVGALVVVNRLVFLSGGVAHSAYGGIGFAFFVGISPLFGALIAGVLAALLMAWVVHNAKERADSFVGAIWAVGMAIGVIFADLTAGYTVDLMSYLFGSIMAVDQSELLLFLALDVVAVLVVITLYRELVAVSFDADFAQIKGVKVKLLQIVLLLLASVTVVMAIRVVGLMLVIALLTIPTWIAEKHSNSLGEMMIKASVVAFVASFAGLVISYHLNITTGAVIIISLVILFAINELFVRIKS